MSEEEKSEKKRKRSSPKYWIEIKGKIYARLQYKTESGKYRTKFRPITDKRTARRVVDRMRLELELHGEEVYFSDKGGSAFVPHRCRRDQAWDRLRQNRLSARAPRRT